MFHLLSSEQLQVSRETDVCDLIVEWLNRIGWLRYTFEGGFDLMSILACVRWSSVPEEYVRAKLLNNKHIQGMPEANKFITRLLNCYYTYAIPIPLQRTFIRPSLGYEKCFMSFEKGQLGSFRVTMRRIQEFPCQSYMGGLGVNSFELNDSISGAVYREVAGGSDSWPRDALYLTGTGKRFKGILKYDISTGWSKCSDMVMDRKHHRSVFVGSKLFSCGGVARCTIEEFDIHTNKSKLRRSELELLDNPVCVAHGICIYFFGALKDNVCTDRVYSYDTVNDIIFLFEQPMPVCFSGFVPVVYKSLIILFHEKTCLIYDVKSWLWITMDAYRTNVRIFAAVVEHDNIFIFGGISKPPSGRGRVKDHASVRCINVDHFFSHFFNPLTEQVDTSVRFDWKWHGDLNPPPIHYLAYGTVAVPCQQFHDGSWAWISRH